MISNKHSVVITGASTGIGKATALYLAKIGFEVFAGVRKTSDGDALKNESGGKIVALPLDVTKPASIADAASQVADAVGERGLSGLVNNAGIVIAGPLEYLPLDDIRTQFDVNLFGQIAVIQAFLPLIRKSRGRILNMGSISGRMALPVVGPYAASKFALEAITDSLRIELSPWNITVTIIEPGDVATPIWNKSIKKADEIGKKYSDQALAFYNPFLDAARAASEKASHAGISPNVIAKLVAHVLTVKNPRTRYVVGTHAKIEAFLKRWLPDRIFDRIVLRFLGLKKYRSQTPDR